MSSSAVRRVTSVTHIGCKRSPAAPIRNRCATRNGDSGGLAAGTGEFDATQINDDRQSKALVFMFMTQDALDRFLSGNGWTAGADASSAFLKVGANGTLESPGTTAAVMAFALTNDGLMAAATVDGTKVSKLEF
jgi:hypothetical protein